MKYTCNDIFMVRTPSLSAEIFSEFLHYEGHSMEDFIREKGLTTFMDKSILISSRELYKAKERNLQHNSKKWKVRELSFLKYLTRAATRPTPYGLFAGVALGQFSEKTHGEPLIVEEKKATIECRVDHAWLSHFVYELEKDPVVYPQLQVRFNPNCYVSGDRLKNPHYANHGFSQEKENVIKRNHIRNTPLISLIRGEARDFLGYDAIKAKIQSHYPGVSQEKIVLTINMLMENEILLTNLRLPSNCADGLAHVLKMLEPIQGIDQKKEDLRKLNALLCQINGERQIEALDLTTVEAAHTLMESLLGQDKEKDLLAVNKGTILKANKLPGEIKTSIENFIEGITCLQVATPSQLERFKQQFQEEYGTDVEVPLCEIIDPNRFNGLAYLSNDQALHPEEKDRKIKQIVDEKILYCLQTQGEEVVLWKSDFDALEPGDEAKLPESFDINFFVTKENGGYSLSMAPIGGSQAAGDMFNRFAHVLDPALFRTYQENNKKWIPQDPDVVSVEIREESVKGRLGNINDHSSGHPYYIALATSNDQSEAREITLDDLLIGMQNNRLYIKSKRLRKQCEIHYDCMINLKALSDVARLLIYISSDDETALLPRIYNLFANNYVFTPRILFEGIMTQPKNWNFPASLLKTDTFHAFADSFQALREKYHVDDVVYLVEMDNRLALPLDKVSSLEILYKHLRKHGALRLDELEKNLLIGGVCLDARGNSYITEISCSLSRTTGKQNQIQLDASLDCQLQEEHRTLALLQEGWIYAKLYHLDDRENEVLRYLIEALPSIGGPNFFYLRYSDEVGRHLRVRFQYQGETEAQNHLPSLQDLLKRFREYGLINKIQFDLYCRENNRYGGSQLIQAAERVFFADSRFVVSLLQEFDVDDDHQLEQAYLLGICTILTAFFDQWADMLKQVNLAPMEEENKKAFRKQKTAYIGKIQQLLSGGFSNLSDQTRLCLREREKALTEYRDKMKDTPRLTNAKESIIASVIHMFCNRLTGERSLEQKYLNIIREALSNIVEKERRLAKKEF